MVVIIHPSSGWMMVEFVLEQSLCTKFKLRITSYSLLYKSADVV